MPLLLLNQEVIPLTAPVSPLLAEEAAGGDNGAVAGTGGGAGTDGAGGCIDGTGGAGVAGTAGALEDD